MELLYGSLTDAVLSDAILAFDPQATVMATREFAIAEDIAVPVKISAAAYKKLTDIFGSTSDEELLQQFALSARGTAEL